jgi:RNA polymerase sigma-70 factor (ECF subfamily)
VFGARAVGRLWGAANRREPAGLVGRVRRVNGEPAVVVSAGSMAVASIHVETRDGLVVGLRVIRDPRKLARLGSEAA